ncbi:MAG: GTP pyrophosphokinase family protein [Ruminococcaceae bacterium]|nr:GTP pyrophosphokinase family protein [Oscillospiraceae bacterium]
MQTQNNFDIIVASLQDETDIQQKFDEYSTLMAYFRCAIMEVQTKFNVLNEEFSLQHDRNPINSIHSRLKSIESISRKLKSRDIPFTLSNIEKNLSDVAGIRVICSFTSDVYLLAKALLKQDDITLVSIKDYIKNPKPNGYRSLHLIVNVPIFLVHEKKIMTVEIQLRTIAMDSWAALEHQLKYKKDNEFTEEMTEELYRCAKISADLDMRMDNLKSSVYEEAAEYNLDEYENKIII